MKGYCCILVFCFSIFFSNEKGWKCYLLSCNPVCKVKKMLVITFFKNMKVVFLPNWNLISKNETEPLSCITSSSEEQKYTKKNKELANSLASAAIIGLLHNAMSQNLWRNFFSPKFNVYFGHIYGSLKIFANAAFNFFQVCASDSHSSN